MRKVNYLIVIVTLFVAFCSNAQTVLKNLDSAKAIVNSTKIDTTTVITLQRLGGHYNVVHLDSAAPYLRKGITLAEQLGFDKGRWMNQNTLGVYHERKTQYDSAFYYLKTAKRAIDSLKSTMGVAIVYNNLATVHIRTGDYSKAIELLFDALEAEEQLGNRNGIGQAYNNIGLCYYFLRDFNKAADYLERNLVIQEEIGNDDGLINGYGNVAAIQHYNKDYKGAIASYNKAYAIARRINDLDKSVNQISNLGLMYMELEDYKKSDSLFKRALHLRDSLSDDRGLATTYATYAEGLISRNRLGEAKELLNKALKLSKERKLLSVKVAALAGLSEVASAEKDFESANEYTKLWKLTNDTILNEERIKAVTEFETKYETEKKQKEILSQRAEIAEKDLEVRRKNTWIYGSLGLALVLGLLGYLFFNQQKLKNRQLKKEGELNQALARIETQNKLQEQRLRISRDLHDNIGSQLTFVTSSVDNLKFGLKEDNPKVTEKLGKISEFTTQTIYELRDTIWAMNKTEIAFEDLQTRIANFIENAGAAAQGVDFQFVVSKNIDTSVVFSSIKGMNIYRIIQEAVNNALKYASPQRISVTIDPQENGYVLQVKDDGKGFNKDDVELGNGLANMKKRARDLNGSIDITSIVGDGTSIRLQF